MFASFLAAPLAFALQIEVRAEVAPDLRTVRGTFRADEPVTLVDPLGALPAPTDDRTLFRTFPGKANTGAVTWAPVAEEPGAWTFEARLPTRYGDIGVLPRDGAWANGGWYPQPVDGSGVARVADWSVELAFPEGVVGVLNGKAGTGRLAWEGTADRAAFAAIVKGRVSVIPARGGTVTFIERDAHERGVAKWLGTVVEDAWPLATPPDLVVVEDLDLQRLARPAPGMVFLSDRAFRLSPGFLLRPYHVGAVRREVAAAALQGRGGAFGDGWVRDFGGAALTEELPAPSVEKLLGWFSWNPVIDALLYDGTLPYFEDIFDEPFGGPPGLFDVLGDRIPGRAAAMQVDDLLGEGASADLTRRLLDGVPLPEAAAAEGVPAAIVEAWSQPYPDEQDYLVHVTPDSAHVVRDAPPDAPPEVVIVKVDGAPLAPWLAGPGSDELDLPDRPRSVQVDPEGHVREDDLANGRWPVKWTVVLNGGFYNIIPSQHTFALGGDLRFRRRNDTRNVYVLGFNHDAQDVASVGVGWVRWLGPLVDRRTRTHRLTFYGGPSLLDPAFRPTDRGAIAIGGTASYAWDTRTDDDFPLSGHRVSVAFGGGFVPQSEERWASASVSGLRFLSPHPRHVFGIRTKMGVASGNVEHRLLPLGGPDDVRALSESAVVGNARIVGTLEYRWAPLRNASVPLPLTWLSEVHLSPAVDAGVVWRGEERHAAVGAALGLHGSFDLLGAKGSLGGVTAALPIWTDDATLGDGLQLYVDFSHAF